VSGCFAAIAQRRCEGKVHVGACQLQQGNNGTQNRVSLFPTQCVHMSGAAGLVHLMQGMRVGSLVGVYV
jgi:hypothetical protein